MNARIYRQALEIANQRYGTPSDRDVDGIAFELMKNSIPEPWDTIEDSPCIEPIDPAYWPEGY